MHATAILHRCLDPLLPQIHRSRLKTLFAAVVSTVKGPGLTLTDIGRRFGGPVALRHKIKRADRLLGNRALQGEARTIYAALSQVLLAGISEPVIVIDWSDLKRDQSLHLLRAALPVGGRSLTLYEEIHPQSKVNTRVVQSRFLQRLASLLPPGVAPIIVADAGFRVPFYRVVNELGWRWVGRVRGRDRVCPKMHWGSCKTWFKRGTQTPHALGTGAWVRSNRLEAYFVLVKQPPRGRRRQGRKKAKRADCDASRSAREPWLLAASPRLETLGAKQIVRLYRQRMQIEEGFRDMKSLRFGQGLERCHSQGVGRFTVLVLIASLSAFLLWLIGTAAIDLKLDRTLCPGARRRRAYSRLFLARLLLTLDGYRQHLGAVFDTMTSIDQWVATEHMAVFDDSGCRG